MCTAGVELFSHYLCMLVYYFLYVCMYVCMYVTLYACMHLCMCMCVGGGEFVCMYIHVHTYLYIYYIEIFNPNDLKKKAIIIGNVYRPPYNSRDSYTTFSLEFNAMLLEYRSTSQTAYICGDYNIDLLKVNDLKFTEEYFHDILSAGYIPTITLPTRLSASSSLIDNIFTKNLNFSLYFECPH